MFFPAKMCKVRLIGPKSMMRKTIEALESYGGAEIKKVSGHGIEASKPLDDHSANVEKLLKLEALAGALEQRHNGQRVEAKAASDYARSREYWEAEREISEITKEMDSMSSEMEILRDKKSTLAPFAGLGIDFSRLGLSSAAVHAGTVDAQKIRAVEAALEKTSDAKWFFKRASESTYICVVAVKSGSDEAIEEVARAGFEKVQLPEMSGKPSDELRRIESRAAEIGKKRALLNKKIGAISKGSFSKIAAAKEHYEIETGKSSAATSFGATQHSFIVEAYIPEKKFSEFAAFTEKTFSEKVEVRRFSSEQLEHAHEEAPTLLEHRRALAPFEWINKYMSVPRSGEIDPTLVFLVFFPFFYAMMVGDVIYGVISFLIARFIVKKVAEDNILKPVGLIWMWSAIPTIIFGVIYDEFMGMPHTEFIYRFTGIGNVLLYHGVERLLNVKLLLGITILIGIVAVCTGFLLGFLNAAKHGNRKHALAKLGWLGVVAFGTVLISGAMFNAFSQEIVMGSAALLLVSLGAVVSAEGIAGIIELPSVLGNVMSFTRVLAVGLVGTLIALILNHVLFPSIDKGLLLIILVPVYIAGHIFNAFLTMFESFIQSARLNFVEMYSKFYEGGGREFAPFKLKRKYLKD